MRQLDAKFKTSGDLTKLDGTPIPDDEPVILFRGNDKLLPKVLEHYKQLCTEAGSPANHLNLIDEKIDRVNNWQSNAKTVHIPD